MKLQGKVIKIGDVQSFGSNGFQKRDLVIETEERYPQKIALELHGEKCSVVDNVKIGETLECSINVRGREWVSPQGEVKYFNTLVVWRVESMPLGAPPEPAPTADNPGQPLGAENEDDDTPF